MGSRHASTGRGMPSRVSHFGGRRVCVMCDFCIQHGEGEKWYLQAKHYSADLLSDVSRRRFAVNFLRSSDHLKQEVGRLDQLSRAPGFIQRSVKGLISRRMRKWHFGQVIPLEEVEQIFGFVNSITRTPCICREVTLGREARYCYAVSLDPGSNSLLDLIGAVDGSFSSGPDTSSNEQLSREQALALFAEHDKEGLCHSVWTFKSPFIGGICNCDRSDCLAMRTTLTHDLKMMFRAEWVAAADPDLCVGCRSCMRVCQFGALRYSAANHKVSVDQQACYGCGVCRAVCAKDALALKPRSEVPAVAALW
jgi:ferredoxin